MREIDPSQLRYLESKAREIAKLLDKAVNKGQPRRYGFTLLLYSFEGPELTYISNSNRDDMIKTMKELLARWEARDMSDFPGGIDARN